MKKLLTAIAITGAVAAAGCGKTMCYAPAPPQKDPPRQEQNQKNEAPEAPEKKPTAPDPGITCYDIDIQESSSRPRPDQRTIARIAVRLDDFRKAGKLTSDAVQKARREWGA